MHIAYAYDYCLYGMESGKPNKEYSHYVDLFFIMKIMVIINFFVLFKLANMIEEYRYTLFLLKQKHKAHLSER